MLKKTLSPKFKGLLCLSISLMANASLAVDYQWNNPAPVKTPSSPNGKTILFDVSHGGTEGNADWVIDGGFSDFADALVSEGYQVEEYRGVDLNNDGNIQYLDDVNTPSNATLNEAIITYDAISHGDVFVLAETNRPFKTSEYQALLQFVQSGKGIYFIGDHYNADRNLNSWDATEVFNGYNRSTLSQFNIGGEYGDLRNPGDAQGWLSENFGVRFRFNAVDYLAGASDITPALDAEGITQDVDPILMAAGATLAITDKNKAKGLVYFSQSDNATKWKYAIDEGLYFGGRNEGPYVAISKLGLGKAAFIGDSSPIEDATPKYKRQDSGSTKKTYPGWTDPGHGATLSINIINWLASQENYTQFDDTQGHTSGELTPIAKAPVEMDDPDNGNPWSTPSNGYNPWDTNTFAYGSFAAPQGPDASEPTDPTDPSDPTGNELSVEQTLAQNNGSNVTLVGQVTAAINGVYALQLNDLSNSESIIYIKLESDFRQAFSPELNPDILGAHISVTGTKNDYLSSPGVRNVTHMSIVNAALSVSQALNEDNQSPIVVEGIISSALNDIYALVLTDENDDTSQIYVKLESDQRSQFSPELNPRILLHKIRVTGVRDNYMSQAGVKSVSEIIDLGLVNENDDAMSVSEVLNTASGTQVSLKGFVQAGLNGIYGLLLQDENDATQTINIKLDSQYRQQFSPLLNPSMLGVRLLISGKRDAYMGAAGIRYIDSIEVLSN